MKQIWQGHLSYVSHRTLPEPKAVILHCKVALGSQSGRHVNIELTLDEARQLTATIDRYMQKDNA